jgi:recombination protein RecA
MAIVFANSIQEVDVIPTGLPFVDKLTGIGGIPRGVITEIFGDESVGKSTLCMQIVASAQAQGLRCLWADVEWAYTPGYAELLGVDNSKLGIIQTRIAEDILDEVEAAADSGEWDLIILDAVGGILPRADAEKTADQKTIGGQAGLISKFCRKVVPAIKIHNVALIAINHSFVDIMSSAILTSGGKKLRYHKSLSIRLKKKMGVSVKQGDKKTGKVLVGEVKKNKLAGTEGLEADGVLMFGTGFSAVADLLDDAIEAKVITKKGNTFYFGAEKLGLGLGKTRKMLEDDAVLAEKIKRAMNGDTKT